MNLKNLIPLKYKIRIKYLLTSKNRNIRYDNNKKNIFVLMAANYGNLGDCAITEAQKLYFKTYFSEYNLVEISISQTYFSMKRLKEIVSHRDIITIVGGGFNGDLYIDNEWCRQFIIKQFPNNIIISFPQSVYYSNTRVGQKLLKESIKIYSEHKNLVLCAREEYSYEFYKKYFNKNRIILVPDIVLSLDEREPIYERNGLIICMRKDKESFISDIDKEKLTNNLSSKYKIKYYDTHIGDVVLDEKRRKEELEKIWTAFKKSECVITDRLHGMIFCAITGTPCVVLPNNNNKIEGVYKWIKNIKNIKMVGDVSQVENAIESVKNAVNNDIDLNKYFKPLNDILEDKITL